MAAKVDVLNRALQKLGSPPIIDATDTSVRGSAVSFAYEPIKQSLLRKYTWSFALDRIQLASDAISPVFGKASRFLLPASFIRLYDADPEYNLNSRDWNVEGRYLLTNDPGPIDLRFISDVTDVSLMDPIFREVLSTNIAVETCELINQSNTKKADLKDDLAKILNEAKRVGAVEKRPIQPALDTWITARR